LLTSRVIRVKKNRLFSFCFIVAKIISCLANLPTNSCGYEQVNSLFLSVFDKYSHNIYLDASLVMIEQRKLRMYTAI